MYIPDADDGSNVSAGDDLEKAIVDEAEDGPHVAATVSVDVHFVGVLEGADFVIAHDELLHARVEADAADRHLICQVVAK